MPHATLTVTDIWPKALTILKESLRRPTLAKWLPDLRALDFDGRQLTIGVPTEFARKWLADKAAHLVASGLQAEFGAAVRVEFVVQQLHLPLHHHESAVEEAPLPPAASRDEAFTTLPLNPRYTFEHFVVGKNSHIAHAAAMAVSRAPGRSYNPLFIYGGVGLGKTHLMQAIGNAALAANPRLKICYVSGDTFTYHVVTSIRDGRFSAFREAYRDVDIWLVDDIQFIASRERTEAEFFQAFNALHETGKQIVVSSDRPPKDLQIVDPRLRSRFEWGLMADVKAPDLETRIAILQKKILQERAAVPDDVVRYIATVVNTNIRTLEGALVKVLAASSLGGEELTLSFAMEQLRDHTTYAGAKILAITDVQDLVSQHFGISLGDLTGPRRTQNLVLPRQVAMYLCRQLLSSSYPEIARKFGGRDHSTVIYSCTKLEQTMKIDRQVRAVVSELTSRLQEVMS